MKTTKRFDTAVTKLYKAFIEGTLNANECEHCAVGNLCDAKKNNMIWHLGNYLGNVSNYLGLRARLGIDIPKHKHYILEELFEIERRFLLAHEEYAIENGMAENKDEIQDESTLQLKIVKNKEAQFKGLMAVINYLAELDNIEVPQITLNQFESVLEKEKL